MKKTEMNEEYNRQCILVINAVQHNLL